jgi:adenylosuccinate lyase
MALQVRHFQRSEVGELCEPFSNLQKGSSAMPHKRNPIISENLCGLSRVMRGYASISQENGALWHERDISHSSVERIIFPDATELLGFMLERASYIGQLVVNKKRITENLQNNRKETISGNILTISFEISSQNCSSLKFEM